MDKKTNAKTKDATLPDWLLDRVVIDRPLREWQERYPYLRHYSVERQLRKIPKLHASEFVTEWGLEMLQRQCQVKEGS